MQKRTNKFQRAVAKLAKSPPKSCHACGKDFASQDQTVVGEDFSGTMVMICTSIACERQLRRIHAGGIYCKQSEAVKEAAKDGHPILAYQELQASVDNLARLAVKMDELEKAKRANPSPSSDESEPDRIV